MSLDGSCTVPALSIGLTFPPGRQVCLNASRECDSGFIISPIYTKEVSSALLDFEHFRRLRLLSTTGGRHPVRVSERRMPYRRDPVGGSATRSSNEIAAVVMKTQPRNLHRLFAEAPVIPRVRAGGPQSPFGSSREQHRLVTRITLCRWLISLSSMPKRRRPPCWMC